MNKKLQEEIGAFIAAEFIAPFKKKLEHGYKLKKFQVNPFTITAITSGIFGELTPDNMAKALIYPRILGTAITTSFGDSMQKMCIAILGASPSAIPGMDIEFEDKKEGGKVVCQLKSGPNTINSGDVDPITSDMTSAHRLLVTNKAKDIPVFALGLLYGSDDQLSGHYKKIKDFHLGMQKEIPIYVGKEFWWRLTGNKNFYEELDKIFKDVFQKVNFVDLVRENIKKLSAELSKMKWEE